MSPLTRLLQSLSFTLVFEECIEKACVAPVVLNLESFYLLHLLNPYRHSVDNIVTYGKVCIRVRNL